MSDYLVRKEHPHEWWSDHYEICFDREEAETYAKDQSHGTYGYEGYVRTTAYVTLEELDRLVRKAKHEAWENGAFDAALSLGHGGHNATNPYTEDQ